jgi:acyl-CoA thioester hydrolase
MARIKLEMPAVFSFSTTIGVRIGDINYGNHLGNDALLGILHEARLQYLASLGFTELQFADNALIMSDVAIEYKAECHYGDLLKIDMVAYDFHRFGFDLFYRVTKKSENKELVTALAKTGMICFNYETKKIALLPDAVMKKMQSTEDGS